MWFSKKKMFALTLICTALLLSACGSSPKKIKVLILPKFEIGEMTGDMPGEAQLYYEEYLNGAEEYEIEGGHKDNKLYVKGDIAMLITGESKVNSALSLDAALRDERFDYSDAYIISTGCAGSGTETTVMGDVFVITATISVIRLISGICKAMREVLLFLMRIGKRSHPKPQKKGIQRDHREKNRMRRPGSTMKPGTTCHTRY